MNCDISFKDLSNLPKSVLIPIMVVICLVIFLILFYAIRGHKFIIGNKIYAIVPLEKLSVKGVVYLKGHRKENIAVSLNNQRAIKTDIDGVFLFPNLDPKGLYRIQIVTKYGAVEKIIENDKANKKGVVDLGIIEVAKNIALGKPVIPKSYQIEDSETLSMSFSPLKYIKRFYYDQGYYPSNITDGDPTTKYYPALYLIDVIIDLRHKYSITDLHLFWGDFGISKDNENYITDWKVFYTDSTISRENWKELAGGGDPKEKVTFIRKPFKAQLIRIYAVSKVEENHSNWIGIYEIQAYGRLFD